MLSRKVISYLLFYNEPSSISRLSNALRFFKTCPQFQSFTASYLINKFGFSQESALKLSKYLLFKTSQKPDSVISFFEEKGFSKTQTKTLVTKSPTILSHSVKTLSAKWDFFLSRGFSSPDLAKYLNHLTSNPEQTNHNKSNWESKFDVYKNWGLSEKQIWEAFLKYPRVISASEEKIAKTMEFLVNTMGIQNSIS
ncbi:Mitochodrial transcription termination factor-related protein [Corchorus olitorius]|uniref:Mitochodrial transcription termination factor-related protein n=1 Tax=Corchorus olitorius TaxID=93759 RepID=A0A1R3HCS1_9ROSI|nr:Mitochodrial transcription termination factor-related protein [Corchorus olitorius]